MPQPDDLVGLGMSSPLALTLGNDDQLVNCTGTAQLTAAPIRVGSTELNATTSQTGAVLPANALIGTPYHIFTSSSTAAVVYAPVGQYLNGTQNGSLSVAQNKLCIFFMYKRNYWSSNLSA